MGNNPDASPEDNPGGETRRDVTVTGEKLLKRAHTLAERIRNRVRRLMSPERGGQEADGPSGLTPEKEGQPIVGDVSPNHP